MTIRRLELDAAALKAMAHPLRVQILRVLELHDEVSVTGLAKELGETTGAISYHLRQLARHGFVEEGSAGDGPPDDADGTTGDEATEGARRPGGGRRRRWRAAAGGGPQSR